MMTEDMKLVLAILMPLLRLSHGFLPPEDTICGAEGNITCTVVNGGNIIIQVMKNATGYRLHFKKELTSGAREVFTVKKGVLNIREDAFRNRTDVFVNNGTVKIQNVQWEDKGQYRIDIFYANGTNLRTVYMKLEVKANPWPLVVICCASVFGLLVVVLISYCIYKKVKTCNHPDSVI